MAASAVMVAAAWWLVRRFAPEASGSGVPEIEGALQGERPVRWQRVMPVKFFAGMLSLGSGLLLGREGPTIQLGGSAGKMIGDLCRISPTTTHSLIAAGAAAGLAAAFNAPLAGILFVIEEMRLQFRYRFLSVQAVVIAAVVATVVVRGFLGQAPVLNVPIYPHTHLTALPLFLVLGVIFGLIGYCFNHLLLATLDLLRHGFQRFGLALAITLGAGIGLLAWAWPAAAGGGYSVIPDAMDGQFAMRTLLLLFMLRMLLSVGSYAVGVPGGIFAPMLAIGTLLGMAYGQTTTALMPDLIIHPGVFAVAGMSALFAATVRAPLTGLALAIEMTGNYQLILPLFVTCLAASVMAQGLGSQPIYTLLLRRTLRLEAAKRT